MGHAGFQALDQFKSTDLNNFENIILKHGCNALLKHRTGIH